MVVEQGQEDSSAALVQPWSTMVRMASAPSLFGELGDQVHSDHLEWETPLGARGCEIAGPFPMGEDLVLLARGASFHIVRCPLFQPRPPVMGGLPVGSS